MPIRFLTFCALSEAKGMDISMKLDRLLLKNFKGIKHFELNPQGKNTEVYGRNGTGKTTLADAFNWLLFAKDTRGKADFPIKTHDKDGEPIHGLDHEIEGAFLLETGKKLTLKKVYVEKWTKKRGSAEKKVFTGHTTDHFINAVPVNQGEYNAKIAKIIDENVFRLLTDPRFFNNLHWEKRRKLLIEVCGDVSDGEVISSDEKLYPLSNILQDYNVEEYRKILKARRAEINKELEKIPVRIDERGFGLGFSQGFGRNFGQGFGQGLYLITFSRHREVEIY